MPEFCRTGEARRIFHWTSFLRCFFLAAAAFLFEGLAPSGTSPYALSLAAALGTITGGVLAFSRLRLGGFILALLAALLFYQGLLAVLQMIIPGEAPRVFAVFSLLQHLNLCYAVILLAALSAWFFWKYRITATIELILLTAAAIALLSGHRNFHFDAPLVLNDLAWRLHFSQLGMLVVCGAAVMIMALFYIYLATLPGRPLAQPDYPAASAYRGARHTGMRILTFGVCGLALYAICSRIYAYYNLEALTRTANGVGQEKRPGLSPLGFHSALGATNQPAALVRLEGDYPANPFTPMLYLRENALSAFNGHELVIAGSEYDKDVPAIRPEESFKGLEDTELVERTPVIQSIYLLAEHQNAFALDYPLSMVRLKNPDASRFRSAYRVYSVAPAFSPEKIKAEKIGDARWAPETLQHYLTPHPDPRYRDLAFKITAGVSEPVERMLAITSYLSRNTIYTLSPGHAVDPDEDPVAPFLFGDLRGYCVHFAHAMVYLARSLGIPARIGTGYLTDLSQSKDGHILLRLSDRHAWAEIYVSSYGWVPFDVRPDKVESHAESPVDMKILEELMGLLGPGEEILPDSLAAQETRYKEPPVFYVPGVRDITAAAACLLLLFFIIKAWLRLAWMLPGSPAFKCEKSYIAVVSTLHDLGFRRHSAETREEFLRRMVRELRIEVPRLYSALNLLKYAPADSLTSLAQDVRQIRRQDFRQLRRLPLVKRFAAFLNPASVLAFLAGGGW